MNNKGCCEISELPMYEFMSAMGISYLHPGMFSSTNKLISLCDIKQDTSILNVGCGDGATLVYLAKRGCRKITGIDISEDMISRALEKIKRENMEDKIIVKKGEAQDLPFPDSSFEVIMSEAVLILVPDQKKALREYIRVGKQGGLVGSIEPAWVKKPSDELVSEFHDVCKCEARIHTFDEWVQMFSEAGLKELNFLTFKGMEMDKCCKSINFLTLSWMMLKFILEPEVRKKMKGMMTFFCKRKEEIGYIIYVGKIAK